MQTYGISVAYQVVPGEDFADGRNFPFRPAAFAARNKLRFLNRAPGRSVS